MGYNANRTGHGESALAVLQAAQRWRCASAMLGALPSFAALSRLRRAICNAATKKGPPITGRTYSGPGAATGAVAQRRATVAPFLSAPKKQRVVLSITFSCQTTYYYFQIWSVS